MSVELSRRVAYVGQDIQEKMSVEEFIELGNLIDKAKNFEDLPENYQELILEAENERTHEIN